MEKTIYEQMADRIFLTGSTIIPQLFEMIASLEEAELLMKMPGSPDELAKDLGKAEQDVEDRKSVV
jgi:hypothetical protein